MPGARYALELAVPVTRDPTCAVLLASAVAGCPGAEATVVKGGGGVWFADGRQITYSKPVAFDDTQ